MAQVRRNVRHHTPECDRPSSPSEAGGTIGVLALRGRGGAGSCCWYLSLIRNRMIRSFRNERTAEVFEGRNPKGFPSSILKTARRKLALLNAAAELDDLMSPPGNR